MKNTWNIIGFPVSFAIFAVLTDAFGAGGSILGLLLFPLAWLIRVDLREHQWRPEDGRDE